MDQEGTYICEDFAPMGQLPIHSVLVLQARRYRLSLLQLSARQYCQPEGWIGLSASNFFYVIQPMNALKANDYGVDHTALTLDYLMERSKPVRQLCIHTRKANKPESN